MRIHLLLRRRLVACSLPLLFAAGCGDEVTNPCPQCVSGGKIQGIVRWGALPVEATVRATRVPEHSWESGTAEVEVQPDGTFWLDVPAGRYVVGLRVQFPSVTYEYSAEGLRYGDAPPDTLRIDEHTSPVAVHFDLASARVHLELPADLEGQNVQVQLQRSGVGAEVRTFSGSGRIENGTLECAFPGILPGSYRVEMTIWSSSQGEHVWLPGVRDPALAPWFELPADSLVELTAHLEGHPAHVQGRVTGAWQTLGIAPPEVSLWSEDSVLVSGPRAVFRDGSFDFTVALLEPVKLRVRHDGIDQWIGGRDFREATLYTLAAGETLSGLQSIESGMRIDFEAPDSYLIAPQIEFYDAGTRELVTRWSPAFYPSAVVGIANLVPGTYLMRIDSQERGRQSWIPQWYERAHQADDATPVTIANDGDIAWIAWALETGGSLAGSVREMGSPTSYQIYLTASDDPSCWASAIGSTTFQFKGLPDAAWKIGAWRRDPSTSAPEEPPSGTVWYPGTTDWQEATVISTHDHEEVTGIEIVIPVP